MSESHLHPDSQFEAASPRTAPLEDPIAVAARHRAILVRAVRLVFVVLLFTVTFLNLFGINPQSAPAEVVRGQQFWVVLAITAALAAVVLAADLLTPKKKISTLISIVLGLLAALIATIALSAIIDLLVKTYEIKFEGQVALIKVLMGISLAYLAISIVLQTQDDFRLVIPYVEFAKQIRGVRPLLIDSSALIDARLVDIAQTGIIQSPMVIPKCVVTELQTLADSSDRLKRAKGRRGLDVITRLQRSSLDVTIDDAPARSQGVDQILIELARAMPAIIVTTDSGLSRVAQIQGVEVVNINTLAAAVKPSLVSGESLTIMLTRAGEQPGQGVGYLDDGTMVVVDDAADRIGTVVSSIVTSTLQTAAGRLIFAKLAEPATTGASSESPNGAPSAETASDARGPLDTSPDAPSDDIESASTEHTQRESPNAGGPFPPRPPRSIRGGTPRNPRR
ncbi:MAG: hypothetical protein SFY96_13075 [Planctomycetota bacterium]|nr:hypothetical protein [Planctomycetota bacterium]